MPSFSKSSSQSIVTGPLFLGGLITKIFLNVRNIYQAAHCQIPEGFNLVFFLIYSAFPVYRPNLLKANTVMCAL